jgi:hypothetical protein
MACFVYKHILVLRCMLVPECSHTALTPGTPVIAKTFAVVSTAQVTRGDGQRAFILSNFFN